MAEPRRLTSEERSARIKASLANKRAADEAQKALEAKQHAGAPLPDHPVANYLFKRIDKRFGIRKLTEAKAWAFLGHVMQTGNLTVSARKVGVHLHSIYQAAKFNPRFKEALALAKAEAVANLEEEARRRAMDGVEEPVFYQGEEVGTVRKYSDRLMEILLEAHKPKKYGKARRSGEAGSGGGGTAGVQVLIQNFSDGKILAVVHQPTAAPPAEESDEEEEDIEADGTAEDYPSVQVETPNLSDERLELP